jgi:hypothetical protein
MTIIQHSCPRCAIRRTVRSGWGAFCFNCRLWFDRPAGPGPAPAPGRPFAYPFSPPQLLRLERYRSAIHNGLYTDWPASLDPVESTSGQPLVLD